MSSNLNIYRFEGFELNRATEVLSRGGEPVKLTETEYKLLLYLIENCGKAVSKNDLLDEVWGMESETKEGSVYTFISGLRTKLGQTKEKVFIFTEPNSKGYKFICPVKVQIQPETEEIILNDYFAVSEIKTANYPSQLESLTQSLTEKDVNQNNSKSYFVVSILGVVIFLAYVFLALNFGDFFDQDFEEIFFIIVLSCSYGILFACCLALEIAYRFDDYRGKIEKVCISFFFSNAGSLFAALVIAKSLLSTSILQAVGIGAFILISGSLLTCIAARFVLPDIAITAANPSIQTQYAFWAFCKNVTFYNLPIYMIFCLLLFCLQNGSLFTSENIYIPIGFGLILLVIIAFSYISTMVMLDNLLTRKDGEQYKYYGLFVSLLFLRAFLWFVPSSLTIIWYFFKVIDVKK